MSYIIEEPSRRRGKRLLLLKPLSQLLRLVLNLELRKQYAQAAAVVILSKDNYEGR
jgi:hypothetical protein